MDAVWVIFQSHNWFNQYIHLSVFFPDKIIVGSFQGRLQIYEPHPPVYSESHMLLEKQLPSPVLQVAAGKFVGYDDWPPPPPHTHTHSLSLTHICICTHTLSLTHRRICTHNYHSHISIHMYMYVYMYCTHTHTRHLFILKVQQYTYMCSSMYIYLYYCVIYMYI